MQKITDIKEFYIGKQREKINGETVFIEKKLSRYVEVRYVDGWPRFGHFLFDCVFRIIFSTVFGVMLGVILAVTNNLGFLQGPNIKIYDQLFSWLILQPLFYFIFEFSMQASPAKAILGRIVVDEYGNKPTAKQIFIRSVSRVVPFEAFSCLSQLGWHDNWSNTFVLRKKDLANLKMLQKINEVDSVI